MSLFLRRTLVGATLACLLSIHTPEVSVADSVRFATFNASLNRNAAGVLQNDLANPAATQPRVIAEIIQRTNPDVLLINEFDFDAGGVSAARFQNNFLSVSQNGATPVNYPYVYSAPSNTGIPSGFDLDNNGVVGGGNDAFGFGNYPGQFGMLLYSKYPINFAESRTFQNFLWKDMPGALLPDDALTPAPQDWYSPAELAVFRLSSKSHWDIPIEVNGQTVHVLASHPTPPVFDGPENRNGLRNSDEIRFWSDYVTPGAMSAYIYDDTETAMTASGGLAAGDKFVVMGDLNSDPFDGDSVPGSISQLLNNPLVDSSFIPSSLGAAEAAVLQGGANNSHLGNPSFDTADFADGAPGNLRADYVLPSANLPVNGGGVFWPLRADPLSSLTGVFPFPSSDHRLVYVDLEVVPEPSALGMLLLGGLMLVVRRK